MSQMEQGKKYNPIQKRPLDINLPDLYKEFENYKLSDFKVGKNKEQYLSVIKLSIDTFCKENNIPIDDKIPNLPIIVSPNDKGYVHLLALSLIIYDINKTSLFLQFQYDNYPDKMEFIEMIKHNIYESVSINSPFKNRNLVLKQLTSWIKKVTSQLPLITLTWDEKDDKKMRLISKRVALKKYTSTPLAFYKALKSGKKTKWDGEIEYLVHLIYCLSNKNLHIIKCKNRKGQFKYIENYFDYQKKVKLKLRLSELSSRINNNIKKYERVKVFVAYAMN